MKNILQFLLVMTALTLNSTSAFGAIYRNGEALYPTDTWYTITPPQPYQQLSYSNNPDVNVNSVDGEYFKNDHTFLNINSSNVYGFSSSKFTGSYLFDSGFFIGFQDLKILSKMTRTLSPGYRFSLKDHSYVALSLDYESSSNTDKVVAYGLDSCFYFNNSKLFGEISQPDTGDTIVSVGMNYALSKSLVIGMDYDDHDFSSGFTFDGKPVVVDFQYNRYDYDDYDDSKNYKLSGMFIIGENYGLGLQCLKYDDGTEPKYTVTFKGTVNKATFKFLYSPKHDYYTTFYQFAFYQAL